MSDRYIWTKNGFEDFMKGTLGNSGQNLYVSAKGVLQRIFQFDITGNGHPDLLFANSHSMNERPPLYLFDDILKDKLPIELRSNGAFDGIMCDLTGDGKMDTVIACQHNGVHADVCSLIYFSSDEGVSEKYVIELPTPAAMGVAAGNFDGSGKTALAFIGAKRIRVFYQTALGIEPCRFTDIPCDAISVACSDLDADGYDDLYILTETGKMRVYWGCKEGIVQDNYTELPYRVKVHEECTSTTAGRADMRKLPWICSCLEFKGRKCIFRSDNGDGVLEYFDTNRHCHEMLRVPAKGAYSMNSGDLTGSGSCDIVIAVQTDRDKTEESLVLFERDGYALSKAVKIMTRAAHSLTISSLEPGGKPYLFIAQTGSRVTHDVANQIISFDPSGNVDEKYEVIGRGCSRILIGDTGMGKNQTLLVNNEGETPWGLENIYIYTGDENGYAADRRIELPGWAAIDGFMIDITDNGYPDVLVANCSENAPHLCPGITIFHNDGDGPDKIKMDKVPMILAHGMAIGDFRKCGYLDIAACGMRNREMRIFRGGPDGYSAENMQKITLGPNAAEFVPFPWDKEDVDPDYSVEENQRIEDFGGARKIYTADFNGDGWLDIFFSQLNGPNCMIMWGGPDGYSVDRMQLLATDGVVCAQVADLNGNGYPDLILGGHLAIKKTFRKESYLTIYWGGPDGYKENRRAQIPVSSINSMTIGDFNGDGILDIFVSSYHNERTRDCDAFLFYGSPDGIYSTQNMERIFNHSGSGSLAGDFNDDGYCDLAVASHKKEGAHVCDSYVYWGGSDGIKESRCISLPTRGCHGMTTVDPGNVLDRSNNEYYYSEIYSAHNARLLTKAQWEAELGIACKVEMDIRYGDTEAELSGAPWSIRAQNGEDLRKYQVNAKYIQYRLNLWAKCGCGTPRVKSVSIYFEE